MKILIPVDGSIYSNNAANYVASRVLTGLEKHPELILLNVQEPLPARAARLVSSEALNDYYKDESEKALQPVRTILNQAGLTAKEQCVLGSPAEKIAETVEELKPDCIIMGSHGRSALKTLLFGSVTNAVLALTNTPLLMLRDKSNYDQKVMKVGIAVDASQYGEAAVKYVIEHSTLFGKNVQFHLINTVSDYTGAVMPDMTGMALPALSEDEVAELQKSEFAEAIDPVIGYFETAGIEVKKVCLVGNPGDEISSYAKEEGLDVIVMGSHGYGRFKSAVMGSTATRIASTADVPLLIIRN